MMTEETKSTEETKLASQYQLKKQREHILDAPDTYVGGIEIDNIKDWIFTGEKMERKSFDFIPGLYKCFDEAIVNCRDHFIRQAQKKQEGEDRINLDRMRTMMNQENQDEKLEQNEDLAKLRANTSIEKTILSKTLPNAKDMGAGGVIIKRDD